MRHSDYKLLIFDWDGTLADSIGRIVEAMHVASERSGFQLCDDFAVKGIIGLGLPEAIRLDQEVWSHKGYQYSVDEGTL